eukprot:4987626-Alexandrium_andersonii.AAC.1
MNLRPSKWGGQGLEGASGERRATPLALRVLQVDPESECPEAVAVEDTRPLSGPVVRARARVCRPQRAP